MNRVFLSDLHLDDPESYTFLRFRECLHTEAQRVDEIYILGDLVEMWIGDDDSGPTANALRQTLISATKHCQILLMHGNRDFLFGEAFSRQTGVTLIPDPYLTGDGILLSHGDGLCTDDEPYQALRATLRSEAWQQDILSKSLTERQAFGEALRLQSRQSSANKPSNIMDVNLQATTDLVHEYPGCSHFIHGHTHRPGVHNTANYQRIVTGAWERCGWICRQSNTHFSLECFSTARHYGT